MYKSGIWKYKDFCELVERDPLPHSEDGLCLFVAYLYRVGLGAAMVKSYLSATRYLQITSGRDIGAMEYIMSGLKKKVAGRTARTRRSITLTELEMLRENWEQNSN